MRHGRKSSTGKFNRYKTHIIKEAKKEFDIDLERERVMCPEGKTTTKCHKSKNSEGETVRSLFSPRRFVRPAPEKMSAPMPGIPEDASAQVLMRNIYKRQERYRKLKSLDL